MTDCSGIIVGAEVPDPLPMRRLRLTAKRLGAHATRSSSCDPDLQLCQGQVAALGYAATPWVCQQSDWRFRWTPLGLIKLDFMVRCWDAYAHCDFTSEDELIGLEDFPLSALVHPERQGHSGALHPPTGGAKRRRRRRRRRRR